MRSLRRMVAGDDGVLQAVAEVQRWAVLRVQGVRCRVAAFANGGVMPERPPYLSEAELGELCAPLTQGAAQIRFLRRIGIKVERKANGRPLVWRCDVERQRAESGQRDTVRASNQPHWSRRA